MLDDCVCVHPGAEARQATNDQLAVESQLAQPAAQVTYTSHLDVLTPLLLAVEVFESQGRPDNGIGNVPVVYAATHNVQAGTLSVE